MSKKLISCKACGSQIAKSAKTCPHCGRRNKKSIFKRWWFWAIIIAVVLLVAAPSENTEDKTERTSRKSSVSTPKVTEPTPTEEPTEEPTEVPTEAPAEPEKTEGIRPEIKEALDSYEEFFEAYCEIIEKYQEDPSDLSVAKDYLTFTAQYADTLSEFEDFDDQDLNDEELKYYAEVNTRITKMLAEVAL